MAVGRPAGLAVRALVVEDQPGGPGPARAGAEPGAGQPEPLVVPGAQPQRPPVREDDRHRGGDRADLLDVQRDAVVGDHGVRPVRAAGVAELGFGRRAARTARTGPRTATRCAVMPPSAAAPSTPVAIPAAPRIWPTVLTTTSCPSGDSAPAAPSTDVAPRHPRADPGDDLVVDRAAGRRPSRARWVRPGHRGRRRSPRRRRRPGRRRSRRRPGPSRPDRRSAAVARRATPRPTDPAARGMPSA